MKKSILTLTIIALIAGTISTVYGLQPAKTSLKTLDIKQETKINMVAAKPDLMKARVTYFAENRKFMKNSEIKITSNKRSFAEFKIILSKIKKKEYAPCQEEVNKLEQTNTDMKIKLDNHINDIGQNKKASFRHRFNQDMDKLEVKMWSVE